MAGIMYNFIACGGIYLGFAVKVLEVMLVTASLKIGTAGAVQKPTADTCAMVALTADDQRVLDLESECYMALVRTMPLVIDGKRAKY